MSELDVLLIDKNNGSYNFSLINPLQFTIIGIDEVYIRFNTNVKLGGGEDKDGPLIPNYYYISNINILQRIVQLKAFTNKTTILIDSILFNEIKKHNGLYNVFMSTNHKILERNEDEKYILVLLNWMNDNYVNERKFVITNQNISKTIELCDDTYCVSSPNNLVKRIYELTEKTCDLRIDKYYVINLKTSTDRLNIIMAQAKTAGIELTRYDAINGKQINLFDKSNKYLNRLPINLIKQPGSIGCAMSHIYLWENIATGSDENVVILEDDVIISSNFKEMLNNCLAQLPNNWDICFLGNINTYGIQLSDNVIKMIGGDKQNLGTQGYIINKRGINKLLNCMTPVKYTIDTQLTTYCIDNFNSYTIYPHIISHNIDLLSDRLELDNKNPVITNNYKLYTLL
jgi:glycosyl transferase family 25